MYTSHHYFLFLYRRGPQPGNFGLGVEDVHHMRGGFRGFRSCQCMFRKSDRLRLLEEGSSYCNWDDEENGLSRRRTREKGGRERCGQADAEKRRRKSW